MGAAALRQHKDIVHPLISSSFRSPPVPLQGVPDVCMHIQCLYGAFVPARIPGNLLYKPFGTGNWLPRRPAYGALDSPTYLAIVEKTLTTDLSALARFAPSLVEMLEVAEGAGCGC